ncbi:DUF2075 domain-containing protein [Demequina subtropica]|uniref:DUF2075 domain-containing protein n=1 Tax=Demequina subtropica TaxID=1638989 RepID=UPI0009E58C72|nr:DUF2075 domain-containing protein [Demequina subtropica]
MDHADRAGSSRPSTQIEHIDFTRRSIDAWSDPHGRHRNWPVVYTLNNDRDVYVGESLNAVSRMRQHLESTEKQGLRSLRIVLDDTFNKSVCLDLESFLIRMFSGDGRFQVLNRNDGVTNAEYFDRVAYQDAFAEVFEQLRKSGLFEKRIPEIVNSDLFKLSPFKALNKDQEVVVEDIIQGLLADRASGLDSTAVVEGGPGTGKTIVAIYLIKLLVDIQNGNDHDNPDAESVFSEFFELDRRALLRGARIGLVVPQQSLRASIKKVFARTPGLHKSMVLTPYDVANSEHDYDLLVIDETHRLTQYGAQAMGTLTKAYREASQHLAQRDEDWRHLTQIDWIVRRSRHQVFLLDEGQGVRPIDVPEAALHGLRAAARDRTYPLMTQMRVRAGDDYIGYVRAVLSDYAPETPQQFHGYDLRFFEDLGSMRDEIVAKNREHGLARLAAGYAWPWNSKGGKPGDGVFDMEIDGIRLCWNREATDWINSRTSVEEVGSIHTVQGYDLNYVGVIIGRDIYFDDHSQRIRFDRANYFDKKGRANNNLLGLAYSDDDILRMVKNIYSVLLTRGMLGTYVYVCDAGLREHLRRYFSAGAAARTRRV